MCIFLASKCVFVYQCSKHFGHAAHSSICDAIKQNESAVFVVVVVVLAVSVRELNFILVKTPRRCPFLYIPLA